MFSNMQIKRLTTAEMRLQGICLDYQYSNCCDLFEEKAETNSVLRMKKIFLHQPNVQLGCGKQE